MRRFPAFLAIALLLAACKGGTAVTYDLSFDVADVGQQSELAVASMRVIENRLSRAGETLKSKDIVTHNGSTRISLTLGAPDVAQILTQELTKPFRMSLMREAPENEADVVIAGHGGFAETGITEIHLTGAKAEANGAKGKVMLYFTADGMELMRRLFKENKDKYIGLFVRERLVSKLLVETDEVKDIIVIDDIPSSELAEVFADDINVGVHVTFTPAS